MGKKKNEIDKVKLYFVGNNASSVTGSCIYGVFYDKSLGRECKFLLEAGLVQEKSILENYRLNLATIESINAEELDYIFIMHGNIDHIGLVSAYVKRGFKGKIIGTRETMKVAIPLLNDCSYINEVECKWLSENKGVKAKPFYGMNDVYSTTNYMYEFDLNKEYKLSDCLSVMLIPNRHIYGSCSLKMIFTDSKSHKKVLFYSSDLGNTLDKYFVYDNQIPIAKSTVAIYEGTYSNPEKLQPTKKTRKEDLKNLERNIKETILSKGGSVICSVFSLDRSQNMVMHIKNIIDKNEELQDVEVVVDGNLTSKMFEVYRTTLEGEQKEQFDELINWKNLKIIKDFRVTKVLINDGIPRIYLCTNGFISAGRSLVYASKFIRDIKATWVICGYAPENSIAGKLKNKDITNQKYIKVENSNVPLNCDVLALKSFSSHIQHDSLMNYILQTNTSDKIVMVHGAKEDLNIFAEELRGKLKEKNSTTSVIVPKHGSLIEF